MYRFKSTFGTHFGLGAVMFNKDLAKRRKSPWCTVSRVGS